jgi:hypothetical protein
MHIHQIQMKYSAEEDRILLRISSTERAEFRFWLTRRYVKLLWTILLKMLERDPAAAQHKDENVRRTLLGFQHETAVQSGDFAKPFEEGVSSLPLGANPVLLSRISGKQPDQKQQLLCLHPEQGQGIDLAVNAGLLHMISKLLVDAVGKSDWDIKLAIDPDFALPPQSQGVPPHKLN